uniref:ATP-dependent DNA helicase n=1 Tax=Setaria italica TaxID=4555 RepID=K3XRA4_SETIT
MNSGSNNLEQVDPGIWEPEDPTVALEDKDALYFRKNIRYFNSHFSFTSFGASVDRHLATAAGMGVYTFKVHGQIYHKLDQLKPSAKGPRHMQLYFYDTDDTMAHRARRSPHLDANLIRTVLDIQIQNNNPYVHTFRHLGQVPNLDEYKIELNTSIFVDQRRFNSPAMDQVATIWQDGSDEQHKFQRSIMVHANSGHAQFIKAYHVCYDPVETTQVDRYKRMPSRIVGGGAEKGSVLNLLSNSGSRLHVSAQEYYCYIMQIRDGVFNIFVYGGHLFQQWIVDIYIKIGSMSLDWYSNPDHQKIIRVDLYQGILDTLAFGENFPGSDRDVRDVRARFMDAMALVVGYGRPDYFVTMTCNPYWPEIMEKLLPGQTPQDRPDIVARVYHAKLLDLHDFLINKGHFGKVAAWAHVTEFRKRVIHRLVCTHMMHGSCGTLNPHCACMVDGQCRFNYPRQFCDATQQGKDAYPSRDYYRELIEERKIGFKEEDPEIIDTLNAERRVGFNEILDHVVTNRGKVFFVDSPGGTGKTYLYRALLAKGSPNGTLMIVRSMDLIAIATATSGMAASIMPGGHTAHSRFKIPIKLGDNSVCNFTKQSGTAALLHIASLIIWDEVAMTRRQVVETLDRSSQDIMGCTEPCYGNMRAQSDSWYSNFLLRIGNGIEETYTNDYVQLSDDIAIEYNSDKSIDILIEHVFPDLKGNRNSTNEHVDGFNARMIDMFSGKEKVYYNSIDDNTNNNYPLDFLNSIILNGLPPRELKVKKNYPVILLQNLDPHNGLYNGTRLVVRGFEDNAIDAEIVNGQHAGNRVFLLRIPVSPSEDITLSFKFKRKQFPIRL